MSFRRFATGAALAIAGLAAAVGIGLLANSISGDSVGLSAEPLSAARRSRRQGRPSRDRAERRTAARSAQRRSRKPRAADADAQRERRPRSPTSAAAPRRDDNGGDDHGGDDDGGQARRPARVGLRLAAPTTRVERLGSGGSDDSGEIDDEPPRSGGRATRRGGDRAVRRPDAL